MTVFVGCGFAAKYRDGGGNFSVPLQWLLGLRRLKHSAVWLEYLPGTKDARGNQANIENFQRRMRENGIRYCLLYHDPARAEHDLEEIRCIGMSKVELVARLAGPNVLLNLSYSIHPPLLLQFERRIFCDLDPSEIFYWMTRMEMGQSHHHEFWTIGLNVGERDCLLPKSSLNWKTFFPLADTELMKRQPRPRSPQKFTTIGQWYWDGAVEVDGVFPDLSKKFAFEPYLNLPTRVPEARFELAMNINPGDPERARLQKNGWFIADPHRVARTPGLYRRYLSRASAEFTAIKGVDVAWRTGWLSDRAAAFAALGRPVITEDTGAGRFLQGDSGFHFVSGPEQAAEASREVLRDWLAKSRQARACAVEFFDSAGNLKRILGP